MSGRILTGLENLPDTFSDFKYVGLGFDDFFYTPITRQSILATIGKYLGFEPITTPTD